jgi:tetratricopeptide (TPR) repeat protein
MAAFDAAIETVGFVPYREAYDYFRTVDVAIEEIAGLLEVRPGAAMELAEHALAALEEVLGAVDDSDGGLMIAVSRLGDLHLAACAACSPDPAALAERLFRAELGSELEAFTGAAATYADILGPVGLARYRRLAEAEWSRLPALGPGASDRGASRRFRVTAMMEALAQADRDLDGLVRVMAHDLSLPYGYLRIAEVLQEAGRAEEALAWAERGLRAFPERHDSRLSDLVADAYLRAGRHEEAMSLTWEDFVARPVVERYERLRERAAVADAGGDWRERALTHLRELRAAAGTQAGERPERWAPRADASELVRILLVEDDLETAWAEARAGGCSDELWLRLAGLRELDHPEDALEVYRRGVERAVARANQGGYDEAVVLLQRLRPIMHRLGRQAPFGREVAQLRTVHRRKRNLVRLLDGLDWPEVPPPASPTRARAPNVASTVPGRAIQVCLPRLCRSD